MSRLTAMQNHGSLVADPVECLCSDVDTLGTLLSAVRFDRVGRLVADTTPNSSNGKQSQSRRRGDIVTIALVPAGVHLQPTKHCTSSTLRPLLTQYQCRVHPNDQSPCYASPQHSEAGSKFVQHHFCLNLRERASSACRNNQENALALNVRCGTCGQLC